jgi:PAS domain S-box-containing protein
MHQAIFPLVSPEDLFMDPASNPPGPTESRLLDSEERYRLLVEGVRDYAIFLLDPSGRVTSWNVGAERIKGYRAEEIIGKHFSVFYPPEDLARGKTEYELRVAAAEGRFEDEDWRVRKDGSRFWANVIITALRDPAGRLRGFAKVTRDLTARRRAEEQARQLAREQAARAEAEASSRRKDDLLALLAHELRNPLAPILTASAILRHSGDNGAARNQAVDMVDRQVRHLKQIVNDLVDVVGLGAGRVELRRQRLDLARLVRTVCGDWRRHLEQAGLTPTEEAPEKPVWIQGDETRLTQVLTNLLDNSRKFTPRGGRVSVRLEVEAPSGQARVAVEDTGSGIPAELLPRLFSPLVRADYSTERTHGGLGLGLTVVKGLVELHGGRVTASSPGEGRGSTFTLLLPVEPEPAALSSSAADLQPVSGGVRKGQLRVAVVEDHRDAAESLRLLLEMLGCETRVAHTGRDGLSLALEWRPDAVLSDIGLPGLDGLALAAELRKHPATARALLVGISGYGADDDRARARRAGFDHYLVKPADPRALQEILAGRAPA